MDHLGHQGGSQSSAFELQPQAAPGDYLLDAPKADDSRNGKQSATPGRKRVKKNLASQAENGRVVAGQPLAMVPDGGSVEPGKLNTPQQLIGELAVEPFAIGDEVADKLNMQEALQQSHNELRLLSVQLLNIQEIERKRIAADLHDGIGQSLSLVKLTMETAAKLIASGKRQEAVESLLHMIRKVDDAIAELRRTTSNLRPSMLDDLGIIPAIRCFIREFESSFRGKKIEMNFNIIESDVPVPLKTPIFRILQEAMNNAVKHANADRMRVTLRRDHDILKLSIEDNGQGFNLAGCAVPKGSGRGFGLLTMSERARSSNGVFELKSAVGRGTQVLITWRLEGAARCGEGEISHVSDR